MSVLTQRLFNEIESAPETVQAEVLDFVLFAKAKRDSSTGKPFISRTPGVSGGEACIGNSRIAVWMLEDARQAGTSDAELLQDYPNLTSQDLEAVWAYVKTHKAEVEKAIQENQEA